MTGVPETDRSSPDYRWATHDDPDLLVLQPAPVPAVVADRPVDVLRELFARRGFAAPEAGDEPRLAAARGCLLSRDPASGEVSLVVTIGPRAGATRFDLPGLDPAWWARAVEAGQAGVLVVVAAVAEDGTTSREALRADTEAGQVLAALVAIDGS